MADVELEVAEEARVAQNRAGALLQNGVGPAGLHQEHVDPGRLQVIESHTSHFSGYICLTSLTRAKCGTRSTLCWKVGNISGSTELFAL